MLSQRRRRWANIETALVQRLVFTGMLWTQEDDTLQQDPVLIMYCHGIDSDLLNAYSFQ